MQPTHRSNRILQPAKTWFIYLSLIVALVLCYIPTGRTPGVPDWVALGFAPQPKKAGPVKPAAAAKAAKAAIAPKKAAPAKKAAKKAVKKKPAKASASRKPAPKQSGQAKPNQPAAKRPRAE